jgi:hypothetical protein
MRCGLARQDHKRVPEPLLAPLSDLIVLPWLEDSDLEEEEGEEEEEEEGEGEDGEGEEEEEEEEEWLVEELEVEEHVGLGLDVLGHAR